MTTRTLFRFASSAADTNRYLNNLIEQDHRGGKTQLVGIINGGSSGTRRLHELNGRGGYLHPGGLANDIYRKDDAGFRKFEDDSGLVGSGSGGGFSSGGQFDPEHILILESSMLSAIAIINPVPKATPKVTLTIVRQS